MTNSILRGGVTGFVFLTGFLVLTGRALGASGAMHPDARAVTEGLDGGIVVHVGCEDGEYTLKLGQAGAWVVRGLDRDPDKIRAAKNRIVDAGRYGPVSVAEWHGDVLPFVDNSIDVILLDNGAVVALEECTRALRPGGKVCLQEGGAWRQVVKQRPQNTDEWTHALYDASGSSVSKDLVAGPPERLQWTGGPSWTRHHEAVSGFQTMVTSAGRIFYLLDEGPHASLFLPPDWQLIARNAYNGKILWKRPFKRWVSPLFRYKSGPTQMTRRVVAVGDRLFVAANLDEGVTVIDAATGQTIRKLEKTAACEEILHHNGVLYLVTTDSPKPYQTGHRYSEENAWAGQEKWIRAVDPESGNELWRHKTPVAPMSFAVSDRGVFFHDGKCIRALDCRTGKELFKSEPVVLDNVIATATTPTLAVHKDIVLFWGGDDQPGFRRSGSSAAANNLRTFTALSAVDGKVLWSYKTPPFSTGFECPKDILVVDGLVWLGKMMGGGEDAGTWTGRNLHTGEIERQFKPRKDVYWFHQRCHRSKATENFIVSGRTGIEFISPETGWESMNHWVRGACIYGTMPANGLIYQPQHPCTCYAESLLRGFNALAPASQEAEVPTPASERLQAGPAYEAPITSSPLPTGPSEEWPTFRHDNARSCFSKATLSPLLKTQWATKIGDNLSAITVADGKLFVADKDAHVLHALDATSGQHAWKYIASARIDSPPAIAHGRVLFGSRDGYLYCLSAADGALAWRYRVAPAERHLLAMEQMESVWPVHGSPLVIDQKAYCVAGRSSFLDDGMRLVCLDIKTGKLLHEEILDETDPTSDGLIEDKMANRTLPTSNPDILSFNGKNIFMNKQRFDLDCSRPVVEPMRRATAQIGEDAHLFVNTGFLEDSGFHRTSMLYGRTYSGGDSENHQAPRFAPGGKMLAFNETHAFGFSRLPHLHRWVRDLQWHIYRTSKTDRKQDPPWGKEGLIIDLSSHDPIIHADASDAQERTRLKKSLLSSTIKYDWSQHDPDLYVNSIVLTDTLLYVAGPPAIRNEATVEALDKWRGKRGGSLWCLDTQNGKRMSELPLPTPTVYEGMAAAYGKLYAALKDGSVLCLAPHVAKGAEYPAHETSGRQ
jgi:outer membrane protein assembly factor BamB